jgi:hypothetical protein
MRKAMSLHLQKVKKSTGFTVQENEIPALPERLKPLD